MTIEEELVEAKRTLALLADSVYEIHDTGERTCCITITQFRKAWVNRLMQYKTEKKLDKPLHEKLGMDERDLYYRGT
jgi:hypothetical protein